MRPQREGQNSTHVKEFYIAANFWGFRFILIRLKRNYVSGQLGKHRDHMMQRGRTKGIG